MGALILAISSAGKCTDTGSFSGKTAAATRASILKIKSTAQGLLRGPTGDIGRDSNLGVIYD